MWWKAWSGRMKSATGNHLGQFFLTTIRLKVAGLIEFDYKERGLWKWGRQDGLQRKVQIVLNLYSWLVVEILLPTAFSQDHLNLRNEKATR
jgi:hypothetical protein